MTQQNQQQPQQQQPQPTPTPTPTLDPWVVQQPKQIGQVPTGNYVGTFKGVTEVKLQDGSVKWRWAWTVKSGPEAGKEASALTDRGISPTALPGVLIAGLLGRQLMPGEHVKSAIDACAGKDFIVGVQPGPKGGKPCVRMVMVQP
jgi:hypothetical protein